MKQLKQTLITLVLVAFGFFSQNAVAETPFYKIEVIVFESLALSGWTEEYWPEDTELPITAQSTSVFDTNKKPLWIKSASEDLSNKAGALSRKGYRVLFHQAWTQAAYPNKNAHKVLIEGNSKYGTSFLGTVRLYKTRFAHVDFDLEFERLIPQKVRDVFAQQHNISTSDLASNWRFDVKESRKIRPTELHYIDHPLFGILVQIETISND